MHKKTVNDAKNSSLHPLSRPKLSVLQIFFYEIFTRILPVCKIVSVLESGQLYSIVTLYRFQKSNLTSATDDIFQEICLTVALTFFR